jgi:hypothetical protein
MNSTRTDEVNSTQTDALLYIQVSTIKLQSVGSYVCVAPSSDVATERAKQARPKEICRKIHPGMLSHPRLGSRGGVQDDRARSDKREAERRAEGVADPAGGSEHGWRRAVAGLRGMKRCSGSVLVVGQAVAWTERSCWRIMGTMVEQGLLRSGGRLGWSASTDTSRNGAEQHHGWSKAEHGRR